MSQMMTVEERLSALEADVGVLKQQLQMSDSASNDGWIEKIGERYKDVPTEVFDEAMRLGREALKRGAVEEN